MDVLTLVLIAVAVWYIGACIWFPFSSCLYPWCKGGKVHNKRGTAYRRCGFCRGKGERVRIGRRVFEVATGKGKRR